MIAYFNPSTGVLTKTETARTYHTKYSGSVRITLKGDHVAYKSYWPKHNKKRHEQVLEGEVELTIQVDQIFLELAQRALRNKSGKAQIDGGYIQAKVKARRVASEVVIEQPIPDGYEEIQ